MHWPALIITFIIVIVLIALIIRQNRQDEKEWIDELNNDYKRDDNESDYEP
jgi:preprotein translocase subunit YajC